ncbi:MAG: hypothetical protein ACI9VS_000101 [Candidatus Binatia bacterium]|jgi:hypothetical protein
MQNRRTRKENSRSVAVAKERLGIDGVETLRGAHAPSRALIGASPMSGADRSIRCTMDLRRQRGRLGRLNVLDTTDAPMKLGRATAIGEGANRSTRGARAPRKHPVANLHRSNSRHPNTLAHSTVIVEGRK